MRVLFTITHLNFWFPLEPIAQKLSESGNVVRVLFDGAYNEKYGTRYLFNLEKLSYEVSWQSSRRDGFRYILKHSREILSYAAYWRIRQPTSRLLVERWALYIPYPIRFLTYNKVGRFFLNNNVVWNVLKKIERLSPPSQSLIEELKQFKPDVVVAASAILSYSKETDYLKAARHLEIPTIVIVPSWDNLTTKGILHEIPDWLFVWTEGQVEEAERFHAVPREQVVCTGAPKYDPWFELKPSVTREEFCQEVDINPSSLYALYLCSSKFISGDETIFIDQLADLLVKIPGLRNLTLLVRPHPLNLTPWEKYSAKNENVVVWPKDMLIMDPAMTTHDLYHSILYSNCVLGINTSAFIEAAIVDKPCIAIVSSQYELTQMGIPHFKHLLDAGFLESPQSLEETANILLRIVKGEDLKQEKRREFVRKFVRPRGIGTPATEIIFRFIGNILQGNLPDFENGIGVQ